jgi:hypothetical protein
LEEDDILNTIENKNLLDEILNIPKNIDINLNNLYINKNLITIGK